MATSLSTELTFDVAANMARQSLYRFAALSLLDPRAGGWEELHSLRDQPELLTAAAAVLRSEPAAKIETLAHAERPLSSLHPEPVLAKLPDSSAALNDEYEQTFGLLVSNACPPYETEYINGKFTFQRSQTLADVGGFYQAFGLMPADRRRERPDHITLQLEFMAALLGLERQAAQSTDPARRQRVVVCRDAQRKFLHEHLAWWVPAFCRMLQKENSGGFFEAAGFFLSALIPAERSLLDVPAPSEHAAPSTLERPEECEGCALAP